MLERAANDNEPPRMTWVKAAPILGVCALFDLLRLIFEWFVIFGPALTITVVGAAFSKFLWDWLAGLLGALIGGAAGFVGAAFFMVIGVFMAMAVGFAGWLFFGMALLISNRRIFKTDRWLIIKIIVGLAVAEIPFIGGIPTISIVGWRLYRVQIRKERAAHAAWQARKQEAEMAERAETQAFVAARRARALQQAAANDNEIPQEESMAA